MFGTFFFFSQSSRTVSIAFAITSINSNIQQNIPVTTSNNKLVANTVNLITNIIKEVRFVTTACATNINQGDTFLQNFNIYYVSKNMKKKMFSHIPQDTTHLIQRPCYQRGSPCQNPARNWTTRRPPDYRKETQTAVVWSCFPFIRSGQNRLARYRARGEKTRQTEEEVERQHQGTDKPGVRQVPEGSGEQGKT